MFFICKHITFYVNTQLSLKPNILAIYSEYTEMHRIYRIIIKIDYRI